MLDIKVNKNSEQPLYVQIRDALQRAVQEGNLKTGERLPTVAAFAEQIGVTQATIRRAFEDLSKAGLIVSHVGRGTFVNEAKADTAQNALAASPGTAQTELASPESVLAARRLRMGVARSLNELMALAKRPGLIQFTRGVPEGSTLRNGMLEELVADALQAGQEKFLGYGDPGGMPELREEIARRASTGGLHISPEQVLITSGSQQAIALLAQAASENQQRVICETPCYRGVTNAFGAFGHWVETVVRDRDGPLPDRLQRFRDGKPSLFYLCPELHNPMGTDLHLERRQALIDWAVEQNALIVSDEIYHDLRIEGTSPESFLSIPGAEKAVAIDSLSKTFMGGLRVGWLISSTERVRSLSTLKQAMDIACPLLMQGIALSLLRSGEYDTHIRHVKEYYRKRRDLTLEALQRYMPKGVSWTDPQGGFQMWIELSSGYSSVALFLLAIERGVAFIPGPMQDLNHRFMSAFRLCYGFVEPEQITEGIELLADAVNELLKSPPGESGLSGLGDFQ
ncbi:MAG: PLP-dependent aminotransferase family protein [bacterium]|nr:PLP-dependent aminotransferase family protein [bacterium]